MLAGFFFCSDGNFAAGNCFGVQIFTLYRPEDAKILQIWANSWRAHGWRPRLLLEKHLERPQSRKKRLISSRLINYGLRSRSRKAFRAVKYGKNGWRTAALVQFPENITAEAIFTCGRPLAGA